MSKKKKGNGKKVYKIELNETKYLVSKNGDSKKIAKQAAKLTGLKAFKKVDAFTITKKKVKKGKLGKLAKFVFFTDTDITDIFKAANLDITEKTKKYLLKNAVKVENEKFNAKIGSYLVPEYVVYTALQASNDVNDNIVKAAISYRKTIK